MGGCGRCDSVKAQDGEGIEVGIASIEVINDTENDIVEIELVDANVIVSRACLAIRLRTEEKTSLLTDGLMRDMSVAHPDVHRIGGWHRKPQGRETETQQPA
jgi:hypothetical protein